MMQIGSYLLCQRNDGGFYLQYRSGTQWVQTPIELDLFFDMAVAKRQYHVDEFCRAFELMHTDEAAFIKLPCADGIVSHATMPADTLTDCRNRDERFAWWIRYVLTGYNASQGASLSVPDVQPGLAAFRASDRCFE